jgi:hypothetical protein
LTWQTITAFSRGSVIVLRSQVFSRRSALNERSLAARLFWTTDNITQ